MLNEFDDVEINKLRKAITSNLTLDSLVSKQGNILEMISTYKKEIHPSGITIAIAFKTGVIIARIMERINSGYINITDREIEKFFQRRKEMVNEELVNDMFVYLLVPCVNKAFRYGYYAAIEDEGKFEERNV